jgi:hypothetical protein
MDRSTMLDQQLYYSLMAVRRSDPGRENGTDQIPTAMIIEFDNAIAGNAD